MSEAHLCLGLADGLDVLGHMEFTVKDQGQNQKEYITLFEPIFFAIPTDIHDDGFLSVRIQYQWESFSARSVRTLVLEALWLKSRQVVTLGDRGSQAGTEISIDVLLLHHEEVNESLPWTKP